jgi:metallo-beta-lactamase family protein
MTTMRITVCGAAGEVTGSGYLVETEAARVLVDCGLFQGHGADDAKNRHLGPVDPRHLDAVVLTHAHLDHCGRLPLLCLGGFHKPVVCTQATADFAQLVLLDSAHIQESDTERSRRHRRWGDAPVDKPLYTRADVERLAGRFRPIAYDRVEEVAQGVTVRLVDAGHMLGSASIEMRVQEDGTLRTIVFSGDVGSKETAFLRDPVPLERADLVFLESTYGDRDHRPLAETLTEFEQILKEAARDRERVLIPAFAIGRTQQIVYHIAEFIRNRGLAPLPIYIDSPMAIEATRIYREHQELFDEEAGQLIRSKELAQDLGSLHFCPTAEDSKKLNNLRDAAVIIASSGMCEGGRIIHHLQHNLARPHVHVVIVGYQAEGTLGRRLVSGAKEVRILGKPVPVAAQIHTLGGFSGHAGQSELIAWLGHSAPSLPRLVLTHGEDAPRQALKDLAEARFGIAAECPQRFDVIAL